LATVRKGLLDRQARRDLKEHRAQPAQPDRPVR